MNSILRRAIGVRQSFYRIPAAAILLCLVICTVSFTKLPAQQPEDEAGPIAVPVTVDGENSPPEKAEPAADTNSSWDESMAIIEPLRDYIIWAFVFAFLTASVIAVWFAIERLVVLRRGRVIPRPFVERFLQHLNQRKVDGKQALKLCEENGSPIAAIFAHGVRKWGRPSVEVEQAIIDGGERQVSQLRKHLRVLNGVATVAPLVGLLGTVIGMIISFNDIAESNAMGNPQQLANGIAMALITTAVGLTIAIPTLITYTFLAGRIDALVVEMDLLAQDVVQLISAEGLAAQPAAPAQSSSRKVSKPKAAASK